MSRAIFLDIDGVLNSNFWNDRHQREMSDGTLIDEEKMKLLAYLVRETNSEIILHSGWRFWFDFELKPLCKEAKKLAELLEKENLHIKGVTPDLTTEEIKKTKKFSLVKADEILLWMNLHKDVTQWVVLDDLDLHNAQIEQHQVKPDPTVGLTLENVKQAKKILLGEAPMDMQLKRAECPVKVAEIVEKTIRAVYPHYYPSGAVQFFLDLHNEQKIREALTREDIYFAVVQGETVGTGSIRGNEICRLFILPEYQGKGYGSKLMDLLEDMVFRKYHAVHIDASFPAERLYLKRGYRIKTYEKIETEGGDYLCYHTMEKAAGGKPAHRG